MKEEIVYLKVKDLRNNPNNPRKNDGAVDSVAKSIEKYGFRNPLIVDENRIVYCGNTRLKASRKSVALRSLLNGVYFNRLKTKANENI